MGTTRTSSTAIRLGITGDPEVKRKLEDIGQTGDAAAQRMAKSFIKAEGEVEAAIARRERQMAKLNAIMPQTAMQMQVDSTAGTGFGQFEGSARRSASVFAEMLAKQEEMERRAHALTAALDPLYAAQSRYDAELREANALLAAGAISHETYQKKLQVETAELDRVARAQGRAGGTSDEMRQAMAGPSFQVQDLVSQISMGANPIQAFIVQGGQLAGQFMYVEGKAGAVARFLMGGWGLALQVALMAAAPFVAKLFEGSEAADEQRKALEAHRKAVLDLAAAQEKAILTAERKQALDVAQIKIDLDAALATRQRMQSLLEQARTEEQLNNSPAAAAIAGEAISEVQRQSRNRVAEIERQLGENAREVGRLQRGYDAGFARMIGQRVEALSDPRSGIDLIYRQQRSALEGDPELQKNGRLLAAKLSALTEARDRELKAVEDSTKVHRRDADTLSASQVTKMLRGALPGVQITNTTRSAADNKRVGGSANSHHLRGNAVDFVPAGGMSSMTKADVRQLFESRGIEIVELLGPGDKNHDDHFHVAWTKGKLSLDAFTDAAKRAKEEAEQLTSLRLFTDGDALSRALTSSREVLDRRSEQFNQDARRILGIDGDPLASIVGAANDNQRVETDRWNAENARRVQQQESDLRNLSDLWHTAFTSGATGIWDMFKQQGLAVISELLARWMLFGSVKGAGGAAGSFLDAFGTLFGGGVDVGAARAGANAALEGAIIPRFASGTAYAPGGWADVGEFGKERVWLPRGSAVSSARDTRRMAGNDNSPPVQNHYHIAPGNLLTPEFWDMIHAGNEMAAARGAAGGAELSKMQNARAARRRITR